MSTELKDSAPKDEFTGYGPHTLYGWGECVDFTVRHDGDEIVATIDRSEFFAAIAKETDVIIFDTSDLPEVTTHKDMFTTLYPNNAYATINGRTVSLNTVEEYDRWILEFVALRRFVENPPAPPIDENAVRILTGVVDVIRIQGATSAEIARAIVASGLVEVKK